MKRSLLVLLLPLLIAACVREQTVGALPTVRYEAPVNCYVLQTVVFDASASTDPEGAIAWYGFDFGDGSPSVRSELPVIEHRYERVGTYWTSVTVIDAEGNKSTDLREIVVSDPDAVAGLRCQTDRPWCPPFYACDPLRQRCDPIEVYCDEASPADCPETLACQDGLCVEAR